LLARYDKVVPSRRIAACSLVRNSGELAANILGK
jgi:hypothetical protein